MDARAILIASWGIAGVAALLLRALIELTPIALEPIRVGNLSTWQWLLLTAWVVFNAYAEGYRGFHRSFSPRVVRRAMDLGENPSWFRVVFAAPYCVGLFHAPRRVLVVSWILLIGITGVVIAVRQIAQPWRGIIDAGVVVGLGAGLLSMVFLFARAVIDGSRRDASARAGSSV